MTRRAFYFKFISRFHFSDSCFRAIFFFCALFGFALVFDMGRHQTKIQHVMTMNGHSCLARIEQLQL